MKNIKWKKIDGYFCKVVNGLVVYGIINERRYSTYYDHKDGSRTFGDVPESVLRYGKHAGFVKEGERIL